MPQYRQLLDKEIATLTVYGCSAEDWKNVQVDENFSAQYIQNVHFSGNIFLGTYTKVFHLDGGLAKHSGIYNCILHNCVVENDVFIDKINNYIANYHIGSESYIENVNALIVDGLTSFGNGVLVNVLVESGGREIPIFEFLSAPIAYMLTFYRHEKYFSENFQQKISAFCEAQQSEKGTIGKNVQLKNCGTITNVRVGDFAKLNDVPLLKNGTIISNEQAPVLIGAGVQCDDFIIQSGCFISDSALISRCFVGQGSIVGKQFSAIDSLLFSNFQGLHGEAVSIFAGPYTVTHHKSTLMLTALYSFMNAGSGTNFSNHMYKLGPVHQGITERGVKTSSDSYIMWPAKIGPFTVVLGRHKGNPDISDLPFSYLMENENESHLLPGINLHSAGTIRDAQKWPKRDNRKDSKKRDSINFDFISPFTLTKALKGIEILTELLQKIDENSNFVWYQNCKIKRSSIKKGIDLYEMAVQQFVGEKIVEKLEILNSDSASEILNLIQDDSITGYGDWIDLAGLLAPASEIETIISQFSSGEISVEEIQSKLDEIHSNYGNYSWNWVKERLTKQFKKPLTEIKIQDLLICIENWKKSVSTFNDLVLRDAKKEFNTISKTGFGIDGNETDKQLDFEAVRGTFEENIFVKDITNQTLTKVALAKKLIKQLSK